MRNAWFLIIVLASLFAATPTLAEQSKRLGPWEVHYNAFNSTLLRPEMAQQYDLERNAYLATLNIAVLSATETGKPAQRVNVSGYTMNPLSMQSRLNFREIVEGDAVYYLTQVEFTANERLRFFITIEDDSGQVQELRFNQEFWVN